MRRQLHERRRPSRRRGGPTSPAPRVALIALVLLLGGVLAPLAQAIASQRPAQRPTLADIERDVMCPTCGTPLIVSQSPLADRERAFIQALIARGETKAQIEDAMVAQFGREVLATPPAHGFDLAAYLVPLAGAAIALGALSFVVARARRRQSAAAPAEVPPLPPALSRRLDDDRSRYDL